MEQCSSCLKAKLKRPQNLESLKELHKIHHSQLGHSYEAQLEAVSCSTWEAEAAACASGLGSEAEAVVGRLQSFLQIVAINHYRDVPLGGTLCDGDDVHFGTCKPVEELA
mmetsp:Transcript_66872/g.160084  ORF Transcript_66872/g.160084 Transcript_66872/m.160084 type:complete len:110 (-) Transcript_66872:1752-2081(-)